MDVRDKLTALLPPPNDREPASLRQDILDELADHLACAHRRELLHGASAALAEQRVLERFGDPAGVARRLWFDAMKGRIMTRRLLIAAGVLLVAASVSLNGLVYYHSNRVAAQTLEASQHMADALARSQAANEAVLKKLSEISDSSRRVRTPDWNPVTFKLTQETPDGPPVKNAVVTLFDGAFPAATVERTSDAHGIADFGLQRPGAYGFRVAEQLRDGAHAAIISGRLSILPGSEVHTSVLCCKGPLEMAPVRIKWAWPVDLENENMLIYLSFGIRARFLEPDRPCSIAVFAPPQLTAHEEGRIAQPAERQERCYPLKHVVLCGPGRSLTEVRAAKDLLTWTKQSGDPPLSQAYTTTPGPESWADVLEEDLHQSAGESELSWETGAYDFSELMVLRPSRSSRAESGRRRFEVLVFACGPLVYRPSLLSSEPPERKKDFEILYPLALSRSVPDFAEGLPLPPGYGGWYSSVEMPDGYWSDALDSLGVKTGRTNEWAVPMPEALIRAVRAALKQRKALP
jgi:hypothetical protein